MAEKASSQKIRLPKLLGEGPMGKSVANQLTPKDLSSGSSMLVHG